MLGNAIDGHLLIEMRTNGGRGRIGAGGLLLQCEREPHTHTHTTITYIRTHCDAHTIVHGPSQRSTMSARTRGLYRGWTPSPDALAIMNSPASLLFSRFLSNGVGRSPKPWSGQVPQPGIDSQHQPTLPVGLTVVRDQVTTTVGRSLVQAFELRKHPCVS